MKKNKWIIALLTAGLFIFTVPGCSSGDDDEESKSEATTKVDEGTKETDKTTEKEKSAQKEFSVSVLIDGEQISEDYVLANANSKTLSFVYSDSESGNKENLPSVTAKWEIISGSKYVSLSAGEGSEVKITNTNYSNSTQNISLSLTITPDKESYKSTSNTIKLKAAVLAKKDIPFVILYDGKSENATQELKSASDLLLSYSIDSANASEIDASS